LVELKFILNGDLLSPSGKLKSKTVYYQFTTREEYFYNLSGDPILSISLNEINDTIAYSINYFDVDHKLISSKIFKNEQRDPQYFNNTTYVYNSANKLASISKGSSEDLTIINEYFYDEQDRLIEVVGPIPGGGEKALFFYESPQSEKVIEEQFFWDKSILQPYYTYKVNYDNEDRLISKTAQKENLGGEKAGFQYFYTSDGTIAEEKEYDLHFGQQLVRRTVCEYY